MLHYEIGAIDRPMPKKSYFTLKWFWFHNYTSNFGGSNSQKVREDSAFHEIIHICPITTSTCPSATKFNVIPNTIRILVQHSNFVEKKSGSFETRKYYFWSAMYSQGVIEDECHNQLAHIGRSKGRLQGVSILQ